MLINNGTVVLLITVYYSQYNTKLVAKLNHRLSISILTRDYASQGAV